MTTEFLQCCACSDCPFQCQCPVRFGVLLFSIVSALGLTTATGDAETSGKTVFVKLDWDKLMEQWKSGDRAATSVVAEVMGFRLIAPAIL